MELGLAKSRHREMLIHIRLFWIVRLRVANPAFFMTLERSRLSCVRAAIDAIPLIIHSTGLSVSPSIVVPLIDENGHTHSIGNRLPSRFVAIII